MPVPKRPDSLWKYILDHGTNLDGADLSEASLGGFDFCKASLRGANLKGAHLEAADLAGCDLSGADLTGADLQRASLCSSTAEGADFSRVFALAADFAMGDFSRARFCGAGLERANFTEANLSDADFSGAELINTVIAHAKLWHTNFAASFIGTVLVSVDLANTKLLSHSDCDSVYVDTSTLEQLVAAHHSGSDVLEAVGALRQANVMLPQVLDALARIAPVPNGEPFDLMPEFNVELYVGPAELDLFKRTLDEAQDERPLQAFLEEHPSILIAPLAANHRGWVVPQKKLGHQYVPDFLACGLTSLGYEWLAVEIESPLAPLFTTNGEQSEILRHAIRQIHDWRDFLMNNIDYARRARQLNGLGLRDISPELPGLILIGRQAALDRDTDQRRRRLSRELRIEIRTYDFLIDTCTKPVFSRTPLLRGEPT